MSKLTEQLRDRLNDYNRSVGDDCDYIANRMTKDVEALLTEHEKLEQEAEAGRTVIAFLEGRSMSYYPAIGENPSDTVQEVKRRFEDLHREIIIAYRTACEK